MAKTLDKPSLYDTDFVAWLEEQAAHLRAGRLAALDVENVAEELEGLARSDRHELANRLETLILHLLKWDHQPNRRSRSWQSTSVEQRIRIRRLLDESPSLRPGSPRLQSKSILMRWRGRSSRPAWPVAISQKDCPTPSSKSSRVSCRGASCPSNDPPERSTHDRASAPDRPSASR